MREFLKSITNISEEGFVQFMQTAKQRQVKAGDIFCEPGTHFKKMYFITEGMVRCYRLIDGQDMTYHFYLKDEFCVDYYSYLTGVPSTFYYHALKDSNLIEFSKEDMDYAIEYIPGIERLHRLMAEKAYKGVAERLRDLQVDTLETRYAKLLSRAPELFQQIQQRYIATYLGAKPESFSRMKANFYKKS